MIRSFFASWKWAPWAYGGAAFLLLSLYVQVQISVSINEWYGGFYNILQKPQDHSVDEFWAAIRTFLYLALPYVGIATVTGYFTRVYALWWRQAITFDYIPRWLQVTHEIEGASQRIQEDTYRFAKIVESLGLQTIRAIMTLVAFLPILWGLSKNVRITQLEDAVGHVDGSLVWVALFVSIVGMAISWVVGAKLPGLEYNNQKVEAAYRKELVYGEDDKIHHASLPVLTEHFRFILRNYHRLFLHYGYFDIWSNWYDQMMVIVPYVIVGPGLFTGAVTLGMLVQVSNAFGKVHNSFALLIHNWTTVTELRSIWKRLREFEGNLDRYSPQIA
jgi:peptide/bleomycin uptake transporter